MKKPLLTFVKISAALLVVALSIWIPLRALADTIGPAISSGFSTNWYSATASATITATDLDNVASFTCTGGTVVSASPVGGGSATIDLQVAGEGEHTILCDAADASGNTSSASFLVKIDTTAPTNVVLVPNGTLGTNNWYTSNVTISTTSDPEISGVTCAADQVLNADTAGATFNGSCTNGAGLTTNAAPITIKRDASGPTGVTLIPTGTPGTNGWYISDVTFEVTGSEDLSLPVNCIAPPPLTVDTGGSDITGSCSNAAGVTTAVTLNIKRDTLPPSGVSVSADRSPDAGGYFNHPITATGQATGDITSGIAFCTGKSYSGPDTNSGSLTGTCTDLAGNESGIVPFAFLYDSTPPSITFDSRTAANSYGWNKDNVTVNWLCNDATSGSTSATVSQTVTTEGIDQSVTGTCTDRAGNSADNIQGGINIDRSAPATIGGPERPPDRNGWYNHAVNIVFTGNDPLSGVDFCTPAVLYTGPDDTGIFGGSGTCTDKAGNTSGIALATPFDFDHTGPVVTVSASRLADFGSWYNKPLSFNISGADSLSGLDSCDPVPGYSGPDGENRSISGSCSDLAGNITNQNIIINYDATAPAGVAGTPDRAPDKNEWYNHPVNIVFTGNDAASGIATDGCTKTLFIGPDSATSSVKGNCTDQAGNKSASVDSEIFKYDTTRPIATGNVPPSPSGWFNTNVTVTFTGTDTLSGIDTCTDPVTLTTEGKNQTAIGICKDLAGNVSIVTSSGFVNIDKTPPIITYIGRAPAPDANGWHYAPVTIAWSCKDALSGIVFSPVTQVIETEGKGLSATGTCEDIAGNTSSHTVGGINITFTLPTATPGPVPTNTSTVPPTATSVPPTATAIPVFTPTQTALPTISVASNETPEPVNKTGSSGQTIFFILGGIIVAGLLIWLIFFLLGKRKN